MPAWSNVAAAKSSKPPRTITLEPSAFATSWHRRPTSAVSVGIRTIPMLDIADARSAAAQEALERHTADGDVLAVDAYHDALVAWIVSRCTCDPDDVHLELSLWDGMPQDSAKEGLTPAGMRTIFDAYERLTIEQDPSQVEATDDEIVRLPDVYAAAVAHLQGDRLARVRRLVRFVLDELESVTPDE